LKLRAAAPAWFRREIRVPAPSPADLWALGGLLVLTLWFYRRAVFAGEVFYKRDIHLIWYAQVENFVRSVFSGSWPVWDPYVGFGQPFWANPDAQVAYPFSWLNLLVPPWRQYTVFVVSHLWWTGVGLYFLASRFGVGRSGAFVAAAFWIASGPLLSFADLWHHFASLCWMPWVVLGADMTFKSRSVRSALLWGVAAAAQLLAGSGDMTALTAMVTAVHFLAHLDWRHPGSAADGRLLRGALLAAVVAVGLSAAQWMPTLELVRRSGRAALPEQVRTYWSTHPIVMMDVVLPAVATDFPLSRELRDALFEKREPFLQSLYLGVAALALAGTGIFGPSRAGKRFLCGILVAAVLLALGRHAPFYRLAVAVMPPLAVFRYPVKVTAFLAFAVSLLAGMGFEALAVDAAPSATQARRWARGVLAPVLSVAVLEAVLLLALTLKAESVGTRFAFRPLEGPPNPQMLRPTVERLAAGLGLTILVFLTMRAATNRTSRGRRLAVLLAAIGLADLCLIHRDLMPLAPRALLAYRPEILEILAESPLPRAYIYDYSPTALAPAERLLGGPNPHALARIPQGWPPEAALALGMQMSLTPSTAGRWKLSTGYDVDVRGLYEPLLARLAILLRRVEGTVAHDRLLRLGAITHVVALHEKGFETLIPVATVPGLFQDPIHVFKVPSPLPRTLVVSGSVVASDMDGLRMILNGDLDPAQDVLLASGTPRRRDPRFQGTSRIVEMRPDSLRIEAEMSAPGYVVLIEHYDPGWRGWVDGKPAAVLRANLVFRAVAVDPGRHAIVFAYRPQAVFTGVGLSLATAVGVVLLALTAVRW
jgi:hypothetical protein